MLLACGCHSLSHMGLVVTLFRMALPERPPVFPMGIPCNDVM
jgi:hypothetical protein